MTLFTHGFRPFFLLAGVLAPISVAAWIWPGGDSLVEPAYSPYLLHIHDMLFGYVSAVVAGFLLTAMPNWTRRAPVSGWALGALAALWLAGRCVMHAPILGV